MESKPPKPKLHDIWELVLLRGLLEGALAAVVFLPGLRTPEALTAFVAAVFLGGGLLELRMAHRLPGHAFRGILIFTGVAGVLLSGFLLVRLYLGLTVTLVLLIVMVSLWVALRGFASLWLGLSIIGGGTFDRAVPTVAGVLGLLAGGYAMLFLEVEVSTFVPLISVYGLGSLIVHLLVAFRLRAAGRRSVRQQSSPSAEHA